MEHVACMEKKRNALKFWWGKLKEREQLEDLGTDERKTLIWILKWYRLETYGSG
jgi:hypothetical protein